MLHIIMLVTFVKHVIWHDLYILLWPLLYMITYIIEARNTIYMLTDLECLNNNNVGIYLSTL